ncbi:hypothetical protein [Georgenia sp. Z1491]|uniref:hypothetical protein n=1 Tax=Georgenia sp. Z1491 TaxID=3416707 RepID=UPI003CF06E13
MGKRSDVVDAADPGAAQNASSERQRARAAEDARTALAALTSATEPLEVLDGARRLRETAEAIESDAVRAARSAKVSWSKIGAVYGLTKQGAQQRFSPKNAERRGETDAPPRS